jgi:hypothetical protein
MSLPRSGAALALAALLALPFALPAQAKTTKCNVQRDSDKYGPSYITSLKVTNTTCKRGKEVVRAFHKCRHAHGGRDGRCPKTARPEGYKCTETRSKIATQLTGHVTCTKSSVKIVHDYTEFI